MPVNHALRVEIWIRVYLSYMLALSESSGKGEPQCYLHKERLRKRRVSLALSRTAAYNTHNFIWADIVDYLCQWLNQR
jgi:hypothetical protein